MEKINVYFKAEVEHYLNELILILYQNDYFSFLENAIDYKDKIIEFINNNISNLPSKKTPLMLNTLGSNYIFYNSNSRTTWYIFFEKKESTFLVTYITNNHGAIASMLR